MDKNGDHDLFARLNAYKREKHNHAFLMDNACGVE